MPRAVDGTKRKDRRKKILEILNKEGSVRVTELSHIFDTSEVTIRTDLADMEYKGLLTRVHGGGAHLTGAGSGRRADVAGRAGLRKGAGNSDGCKNHRAL